MVAWKEFAEQAPGIAEVFVRRHTATGNLCLLATLRSDGYPRISPMEPRIFEGHLLIVGMPGTTKFRDLARDPRFCLHTATVDPYVGDGDAKLWGDAENLQDKDLHERFAESLVEEAGPDLRGQPFDPFYVADLTGASSVEFEDGRLAITIWRPGEGERRCERPEPAARRVLRRRRAVRRLDPGSVLGARAAGISRRPENATDCRAMCRTS